MEFDEIQPKKIKKLDSDRVLCSNQSTEFLQKTEKERENESNKIKTNMTSNDITCMYQERGFNDFCMMMFHVIFLIEIGKKKIKNNHYSLACICDASQWSQRLNAGDAGWR